jgi:hypothetical protein
MKKLTYLITAALIAASCHSSNKKSTDQDSSDYEYEETYDNYEEDENEYNYDSGNNLFEDGTYSATVDYYNPETDYSATYTLDVEVESNEVTIIYFPNDGYLDEDHISPDELDESGYVIIEGEEGKSYEVQIDQ